MKINHNGVTEPSGFYACGRYTGMKYKRRDLAIVYSDVPARYAAVFTTNLVKAASVIRNKQLLDNKSLIQAIVINKLVMFFLLKRNQHVCNLCGYKHYKNTRYNQNNQYLNNAVLYKLI